jgi:proton-translocating NAD(P)+ transhydrogenase subunit alpha
LWSPEGGHKARPYVIETGCDALSKRVKEETVPSDFISNLYVFVLAAFVGFEVTRRVSPLLHTPLMSLTNALDAIVVVAGIIIAGRHETPLSTLLGAVAVAAAFSNMVGGFLITDRMLRMFKSSKPKKP